MASGVKLESFDHIGIVVTDRDAAVESWSSRLGIGPWKTVDLMDLKIAVARLGPVGFHLYEPVLPPPPGAKTIWADFLNTHGEGLHHICGRVADVDAATKQLEAEGGNVLFLIPGRESYVEIGGPGSVLLELQKTP